MEDFDTMHFLFASFLERKSLLISVRECVILLTRSERPTGRDKG